jgi:O-antigen ligase
VRSASLSVAVERAVPLAVAATIVAFAWGSSSVHWIDAAGRDVRWVVLFVLLACVSGLFVLRVAWSRSRPFLPAAWLVLLALVSTGWSIDSRLTAGRAASLGVLFLTAFLLATSAASLALIERVLVAILVGAVIVALLGLLVLAFDKHAALQPASPGVPTRFRGLGEDSNTAPLLYAVVLPIAAWGVVRGGRLNRRLAAAGAFVLLDASIVAAISRGALAAGFIGVLLVALAGPRAWGERGSYVALTLVLAGLSFGIATIPSPPSGVKAQARAAATAPHAARGYVDAEAVRPLSDEIGGASGRLAAWRGALRQADRRPVAGYGFGTENRVFIDRYRGFSDAYVQNSYIGLLLQIGAVGLASFLALVLVWLWRTLRAYGRLGERDRFAMVACVGVVVAGLAAAVVQSYLTSVGNVATATFWIGAFLLAALGDPRSVWPFRPPID